MDTTPVQPSFLEFWNTHFGVRNPVGHHLRKSLHPRWVRFHSIQGSKRYAETEEEWVELFKRHNRIADEVLGKGARCWLVSAHSHEDGDLRDRFDFNYQFSWFENDGFDEDIEWPVYAAETIWQAGQFDSAIQKIASDEDRFLLFVSQVTYAIFSPYDGGMDVICPSGKQTSILKAKFPSWLPNNEYGL